MTKKKIWINNAFLPALADQSRFLVLYGGYGSGKSYFAATKIIHRITTEKGHRFLVMRKVANTIKQSVFKWLINEINRRDIRNEFEINKTEKTILHKPTGNEIICAGLDDPEKLKSIVDITSVWLEEATEMRKEDFSQVNMRLRGITANYKQIIVTFNPVDENHWLKERFFDVENEKVSVYHTTYKDNHYIDKEYRQQLEDLAVISPNEYRIGCLGEWGKPDVQRPYIHNFSREKHVIKGLAINPNYPVRFSLDFNIDPFVCLMLQVWEDRSGPHIHFIEEIVLKNGSYEAMADQIRSRLTPVQLSNALFTGDATGRARSLHTRDNMGSWQVIKKLLNISDTRLQVPSVNPSVANSRPVVNFIFAQHPDLKFDASMKLTLNELQFTEADAEGNILKKDRNKLEQRSDGLDCCRYSLNTWLSDFSKKLK